MTFTAVFGTRRKFWPVFFLSNSIPSVWPLATVVNKWTIRRKNSQLKFVVLTYIAVFLNLEPTKMSLVCSQLLCVRNSFYFGFISCWAVSFVLRPSLTLCFFSLGKIFSTCHSKCLLQSIKEKILFICDELPTKLLVTFNSL